MWPIALKVLIALAGMFIGAFMLCSARLRVLPERSFLGCALAAQAGLSLALFVALYVIGGQEVTSDVPGYYLPAAHAVLAGQIPFRDFTLSYAPLFPYISAALVRLWDSGKVFALFAIIVNALALPLWHRTAVRSVGDQVARDSSVLYATSGHMIVQTLLGTNQVWVAAALAASSLLLVRGASTSSGLVQALSVCTTKLLAPLFWPVLWIFAPQRGRWLAAAFLAAAAIYGSFALLGADAFDALRRESEAISPGNLPFIIGPLLGKQGELGGLRSDLLALTALGLSTAWIYLRARGLAPASRSQALLAAIALTGLIFMLVSKKSFTGYMVFCMYPALLTVNLRLTGLAPRIAFVLVFNVLLVAEPSLWFHLGGNGLPLSRWLHAPGSGIGPVIFLLVDLALLGCYGWLAVLSAQCVQQAQPHPRSPATLPQPAQTAR